MPDPEPVALSMKRRGLALRPEVVFPSSADALFLAGHMEAIAKARFQRIAVRKARVIANLIRGRNAAEALEMLKFTKKAASPIVAKLLDSAISNARQQDAGVDLDRLVVKTVFADKAPDRFMRRWRPRAQGRATQIVKGISHITLVVSDES
jgi:large subunit ribosomal protein L22